MEIYVYADILLLLNFCMDFIVMKLAGKLFRKVCRPYRLLLGAVFAAMAYCVPFCLGAGPVMELLSGAAGLGGGLAIGFMPLRPREFAILVLGTYALTVAIGGGCMAAYYAVFGAGAPGSYIIERFPTGLLIASATAAYVAIRVVCGRIRQKAAGRAETKSLTITLMDKEARVTALLDTGHSLREPVSSWPVVVAEFSAVKEILPENVQLLFKENGEDDLVKVLDVFQAGGLSVRMRLVPYRSVGEQDGVLIGFRPDETRVEGARGVINKVVVAIYNGSLSGDGEYQALVNPDIMADIGSRCSHV